MVVCLGDYIYERNFYGDEGVRPDTTGRQPRRRGPDARGVPRQVRALPLDQRLLDVRQNFPIMAIWDDHEVEDNYAGNLPATPRSTAAACRSPSRQQSAYAAFFEHMPRIRVPGDPNRIYGSMRLGASAELFLLDERQYRADQPCDDATLAFCAEADAPRAFLGDAQKQWLKDALVRSTATWKLIGNQVMIMAFDVTAARNVVTVDSWDGYGAERADLANFIGGANPTGRKIEDVSFVTGDIHTFFAGRVTPSGRQTSGETPVATEFVIGSITSEGTADLLSPDERANLAVALGAEANILLQNRHLEYIEAARRGYGVLEARTDSLEVSFRSPVTVKDNGVTDVATIARFSVARGTSTSSSRSAPRGPPSRS
jgi:alkaline phosphatase D